MSLKLRFVLAYVVVGLAAGFSCFAGVSAYLSGQHAATKADVASAQAQMKHNLGQDLASIALKNIREVGNNNGLTIISLKLDRVVMHDKDNADVYLTVVTTQGGKVKLRTTMHRSVWSVSSTKAVG